MAPALLLYNQTSLGDDDFVANFVARHDVLEVLLRRLSATAPEDGGQHHLIIGSRGMGKTSLLRRLAIAINQTPDLAERYVPLGFREEQYNVLTLGDFWRNCGEALAEWAEATGRDDLADRLDQAMTGAAWTGDDGPAQQFTAEMEALGRRAVLLVDNLDLILNNLPKNDHWSLRRYLQARGGPVMVGAATHPLAQTKDRDAAFYEFFQPQYLDALDERETERCMRALAARRGEAGRHVVQVLETQPERLRTLHTLTGGNPRVLTLIYRLLETAESDEAMADLDILLDQVTPYYKARIEEYQTPQQRAVVDAIALHWDPVTTGALSRLTNIPSTTLSPLLIRLRKDGLIEKTETSGSYAGHQLVERFLNIWYLMRHGTRRTRQKMRWLVGFLTSFYSPGDLADIVQRARATGLAKTWHPDYAFAMEEALASCTARAAAAGQSLSMGTIGHASTEQPASESEAAGAEEGSALAVAEALREKAVRYWIEADVGACIRTLEQIIDQFGDADDPALREHVAMARVDKGIIHAEMDDRAAAVLAFSAVVQRLGDTDDPALCDQVAKALVNKGVVLAEMDDRASAVMAYSEVVERFGEADDPALHKQVAMALVNMGATLANMDDRPAALAAYSEVVERFGEADDPASREPVARALVNKGAILAELDDRPAAVAAFSEVVERFGEDDDPALHKSVAMALFNKGYDLAKMGDGLAAVRAYSEVVERFGEADDPILRGQVVRAGYGLSWLHAWAGKAGEARKLGPFGDDVPSDAQALINAALSLSEDNFGSATEHLSMALDGYLETAGWDFSDDLERLLRLAERTGYGERLLKWFEETGFADRAAPLHAAFKAFVRGEKVLLDVNPEVRRPARIIYDRLEAARRRGTIW